MSEKRERKTTYAAPALDKAFAIIELLASNPQGLLASEMAAALGRSLGELFRILVVMEEAGYLLKRPSDDRYVVTYKFLDVAYRATPARRLTTVAIPEMQALARATDQSCHLVVLKDTDGLVLAREENPGVRGFALRLGASIDPVRSCSGRVILAFSPTQTLDRVCDRVGGEIDRRILVPELEAVRAAGGDMRPSAVVRGVTDISAPIFGFGGEVMAALTIPFLEQEDGSDRSTAIEARRLLHAATARISEALGGGTSFASNTTGRDAS